MSEPKNIYDKVDSVETKMDNMSSKLDGLASQVQNLLSADTKKQSATPSTGGIADAEYSQSAKHNIVKSFIAKAKKEYIWLGSNQDFKKEQLIAVVLMISYMVFGLITTILTSAAIKFYSTFTLLENIWMCMMVPMLISTIKAKRLHECEKLSSAKCFRFDYDSDGVLRIGALKKSYKVFFILSCVSAVANFIVVLSVGQKPISITAAIFEVITAVIGGFASYRDFDFYCGYNSLRFSGKSDFTGEQVAFIYEPFMNKMYTEEEYNKVFPNI